jgi:hypothetical protein
MSLNSLHRSAGISDRQKIVKSVIHSASPSSFEVAGDTRTSRGHCSMDFFPVQTLLSVLSRFECGLLFFGVVVRLLLDLHNAKMSRAMLEEFCHPCLGALHIRVFTSLSFWGPNAWAHTPPRKATKSSRRCLQ